MIDEKGKLFGKINLLDLILIVLFLALAALAAFFFADKGNIGQSSTIPVSYTVEIQNQDAAYFDHVHIGETVTNGKNGAHVGTISAFEKKPAQISVQTDGAFTLASPEGRFDGFVTIQADATASYPDIILAGEPLKIGTAIAYRSETLAMHGYIVDIDYDAAELKGVK